MGPQATGLLAEISDNITSLAAIPQSQDYCYTHVVIHSTRESATLPFNAFIGTIRSKDDADRTVLQSAEKFTASQVANQFLLSLYLLGSHRILSLMSLLTCPHLIQLIVHVPLHTRMQTNPMFNLLNWIPPFLPRIWNPLLLIVMRLFLTLVQLTKVSIHFQVNFFRSF